MPWLDLPDALELVTEYCSSILAAIKVLSQEARTYTGRPPDLRAESRRPSRFFSRRLRSQHQPHRVRLSCTEQ
jgi:hypothetical protein